MAAYLADIFQHLNDLNSLLQGKGVNIVTYTKNKSFMVKLPLWRRQLQGGNLVNTLFRRNSD